MQNLTDRTAHVLIFVAPVVKHWLEREIAQWVDHEGVFVVGASSDLGPKLKS